MDRCGDQRPHPKKMCFEKLESTHPIDSPCEQFHAGIIFFCIAEQKEGLHQLMDERQDNEAS